MKPSIGLQQIRANIATLNQLLQEQSKSGSNNHSKPNNIRPSTVAAAITAANRTNKSQSSSILTSPKQIKSAWIASINGNNTNTANTVNSTPSASPSPSPAKLTTPIRSKSTQRKSIQNRSATVKLIRSTSSNTISSIAASAVAPSIDYIRLQSAFDSLQSDQQQLLIDLQQANNRYNNTILQLAELQSQYNTLQSHFDYNESNNNESALQLLSIQLSHNNTVQSLNSSINQLNTKINQYTIDNNSQELLIEELRTELSIKSELIDTQTITIQSLTDSIMEKKNRKNKSIQSDNNNINNKPTANNTPIFNNNNSPLINPSIVTNKTVPLSVKSSASPFDANLFASLTSPLQLEPAIITPIPTPIIAATAVTDLLINSSPLSDTDSEYQFDDLVNRKRNPKQPQSVLIDNNNHSSNSLNRLPEWTDWTPLSSRSVSSLSSPSINSINSPTNIPIILNNNNPINGFIDSNNPQLLIDSNSNENIRLNNIIKELNSKLASLQNIIDKQSNSVAAAAVAPVTPAVEIDDSEYRSLSALIIQLQQRIFELESELSASKNLISTRSIQLTELESKLTAAESSRLAAITEYSCQIAEYEREIVSLTSNLKSIELFQSELLIKDQEIDSLSARIDSYSNSMQDCADELLQCRIDNSALQTELNSRKFQSKQRELLLDEMQRTIDEQELTMARAQSANI